jgi:hypothetical protein
MHYLSNQQKGTWIENYLERETAGVRKRVEEAPASVQKERDDMTHTEFVGMASREPEMSLDEMLFAFRDSLSDLASSDDEDDGEDEDDEATEQGKLREDDEPGWVMGTISKTGKQRMEHFRQIQIMLDELTQPGCGDAADNFCERHTTYRMAASIVLPLFKQQIEQVVAKPALLAEREHVVTFNIIPGILPMPPGTSQS